MLGDLNGVIREFVPFECVLTSTGPKTLYSAALLAYQFAEKVKKSPDLQMFQFEMAAPRILPNDHAQFRLEGKPR